VFTTRPGYIPPIRSYHVYNHTNIIKLYIQMICSPYLCSPRVTNAKSGCRVLFVIFPKYRFVDHSFVIPLIYYLSSFKYVILHVRFVLTSRVGSRRTIILYYVIFICLYLLTLLFFFYPSTRQSKQSRAIK
jgi:hypothetical protein